MIRQIPEANFWGQIESLSQTGLTVFAGAGVSAVPPCTLPSFDALVRAILEEYADYAGRLGMADAIRVVADEVHGLGKERRDITAISPDYTLLMLTVASDSHLRDYLSQTFTTSGFNKAHDLITHILLANPTNTLVTCNFDTAFENCIAHHHSEACVQPSIGIPPRAVEDLFTKRMFIKAHGCATKPSSIVFTLKEEYRLIGEWINLEEFGFGIMKSWPEVMGKLLERPVLFLGYSGRDNFYRYIRNSKKPRQMFWLLRDPRTVGTAHPPASFFEGEKPESVDVTLAVGDLRHLPTLFDGPQQERAPARPPRLSGFLPERWDDRVVLSLLSLIAYVLPRTAAALMPSLRDRLSKSTGSERALVQIGIRVANAVGDRKTCLLYMEDALSRARHSGEEQLACLLSTHVGICYLDLADYSKAFQHMQFVQERANTLPFEVRSLNLFHLGELYSAASRWDLAEKCYEQSLKLCRLTGDLYFEAQVYNSLGNLHRQQLHLAEATRYYRLSLEIKESLGEERLLANTLNNLATVCMQSEGGHEEAMSLLKRSLSIRERIGDKAGLSSSYTNFGMYLLSRGEIDEAESYLTRSLNLKRAIGDNLRLDSSLVGLGLVKIKRRDYAAAAPLIIEGIERAFSLKKVSPLVAHIRRYHQARGDVRAPELHAVDQCIAAIEVKLQTKLT